MLPDARPDTVVARTNLPGPVEPLNVANLLGVPPDHKLISLIPVGWPAETVRQAKARPLADVLHWNKF